MNKCFGIAQANSISMLEGITKSHRPKQNSIKIVCCFLVKIAIIYIFALIFIITTYKCPVK